MPSEILWAPLGAHPGFTPSHLSNMSPWTGSPPDRSHRAWALGDPSRNCSCIALHPEAYCVKDCEHFSHSELSASSHPTLPLTSLCLAHLLSVPAGSALSPAALCRGAAPGQSCLSAALPACHELPPSQEPGPAQQQRTSPRRHFTGPPPHPVLPPGVPGAPEDPTWKE